MVAARTGDSLPGAGKRAWLLGRGAPGCACQALILRSLLATGRLRCDTEAGLASNHRYGVLGLRSRAEVFVVELKR
jgi:hypothetical protein